jgi:PAS domain S-box-containing protein
LSDQPSAANRAAQAARDFVGAALRGDASPLAPWIRYGATLGLVLAALAARFAMLPADAGLPFLTFYPVVIASALLFGTGPGLLATALGAALADYYFLTPISSFGMSAGSLLSLSMFVLTSGLTCLLAHHVRTASRELRESEQRLRGLYEAPHVGIALTDMRGRFLQFNEAFRSICGYSAEELQGLDYWKLTPRRYEAAEAEQLAALARTGRYGPFEKEYVRKDGSLVPLQLNGALLKGADGQSYIWSIVEDISERRELETRVASEAARNRMFLQTASDGVHILGPSAEVVEVSDSFCTMLGYARAEVIGMHPARWDANLPAALGRAGIPELLPRGRARFATVYRRKDGTTIDVEVTAEGFALDGERHAFCAARDITEQRRLERAVLEAADREQRRLGHDLHDGLGQELTGISMLAGALASAERKAGRPAADGLASLEDLARHAIATCRAVARGLSPLGYARGGLIEALDEMASLQREAYGADVRFEAIRSAALSVTTDTADHLYRIAQEAVTNARRHAQATVVTITLDVEAARVRLEILDNGIGLAPSPGAISGMGLSIMRYRAALIGASLSIAPGDHGGTVVACECPQASVAAAEALAAGIRA